DLYRVDIEMKARLIETVSKKVIASGTARSLPMTPDNAPTWDAYLASNAQRLKDDIKKLSEGCAEELNLKVFKLPMLPVEAAASAAQTAAAPQVPAPAKSDVPVTPPSLAQTTPAAGPETKPPAGASPVPKGQGAGSPWVDPCSGIEFVWVPEGNFLMGAKRGEADEKPCHHVVLSHGCWMGRYEVTQRQYESVMGMNPAGLNRSGPEAPIETVSWYEAKMYLARLNEKAGQKRYFLPTEAQWEYACWAGASTFNEQTLSATAWYAANAGRTTQPVGKLRANAWGLHDMLGNVWEWCEDWYSNHYDPSVLSDPTGPASGTNKVARGGSWESYEKLPSQGYLKTWNPTASPYYGVKIISPTSRYPLMPDARANNLGFRVVVMP
ncbi:MAG TPA: SUMF1/EgtB/PvdO family nonheme iron enzyme, partial [Holophaga sp.]|nr:SUMF1/EgtB/PvdO family nonheme iron enzyme [Holophaga sp.]